MEADGDIDQTTILYPVEALVGIGGIEAAQLFDVGAEFDVVEMVETAADR